MRKAFIDTYKSHGISEFYNGVFIRAARSIPGGMIMFGVYSLVKDRIS
jgi:hypothetical protein